jgi:hypothetical protein
MSSSREEDADPAPPDPARPASAESPGEPEAEAESDAVKPSTCSSAVPRLRKGTKNEVGIIVLPECAERHRVPASARSPTPSVSILVLCSRSHILFLKQAHVSHVPADKPDMNHFDSPFQVQEYIAALVRENPHDVLRIVERPGTGAKGKGRAPDAESSVVDQDVWLYEQLRCVMINRLINLSHVPLSDHEHLAVVFRSTSITPLSCPSKRSAAARRAQR